MRRTLLPGQTPDDDLLALDQTLTQLERDDPVCASLGNGAPENLNRILMNGPRTRLSPIGKRYNSLSAPGIRDGCEF
jgi:hypothetical protein